MSASFNDTGGNTIQTQLHQAQGGSALGSGAMLSGTGGARTEICSLIHVLYCSRLSFKASTGGTTQSSNKSVILKATQNVAVNVACSTRVPSLNYSSLKAQWL